MKSPIVNAKPNKSMQIRMTFSFTRFRAYAPIWPPASAVVATTATWVQATPLENKKITTADEFITPASTFFVAPALRSASPESVNAASMRIPIPPPKYPP